MTTTYIQLCDAENNCLSYDLCGSSVSLNGRHRVWEKSGTSFRAILRSDPRILNLAGPTLVQTETTPIVMESTGAAPNEYRLSAGGVYYEISNGTFQQGTGVWYTSFVDSGASAAYCDASAPWDGSRCVAPAGSTYCGEGTAWNGSACVSTNPVCGGDGTNTVTQIPDIEVRFASPAIDTEKIALLTRVRELTGVSIDEGKQIVEGFDPARFQVASEANAYKASILEVAPTMTFEETFGISTCVSSVTIVPGTTLTDDGVCEPSCPPGQIRSDDPGELFMRITWRSLTNEARDFVVPIIEQVLGLHVEEAQQFFTGGNYAKVTPTQQSQLLAQIPPKYARFETSYGGVCHVPCDGELGYYDPATGNCGVEPDKNFEITVKTTNLSQDFNLVALFRTVFEEDLQTATEFMKGNISYGPVSSASVSEFLRAALERQPTFELTLVEV